MALSRTLLLFASSLISSVALAQGTPLEEKPLPWEKEIVRSPEPEIRFPDLQGRPANPGLSPSEYEALDALFRAVDGARRAWPGYYLFDDPFLFVHQGITSILVGHPSPPPSYSPATFRGKNIWVSRSPHNLGSMYKVDYDFAGARINAAQRYEDMELHEAIMLSVHEPFHRFQSQRWKGWGGFEANETLDPEDLALAWLEQRALADALEKNVAERLRDFIAVRLHRHDRAPGVKSELFQERVEGTAFYVENRALEGIFPRDYGRDRLEKALRRKLEASEMAKWRLYQTGASIGYILDRLQVDWKGTVEQGGNPFEILSRQIRVDAAEARTRVAALQETRQYRRILDETREQVAALQKSRREAIEAYEAASGIRVRSHWDPKEMRGYSPYPSFNLPDGWLLTLPPGKHQYSGNGFFLELRDKVSLSNACKSSCIMEFKTSPQAMIRLNGVVWAPKKGSASFASIEILEQGVELRLTDGKLEFDGAVLDVLPIRAATR